MDFYNAADQRAQKSTDSIYNFVNYLTIGIPDVLVGNYNAAEERAGKMTDSTYHFANWLTSGIVEMVDGAVFPKDPSSKEHIYNVLGLGGLFASGIKVLKPVKPAALRVPISEVKIPESRKVNIDEGKGNLDFIDETGRLGGKLYSEKDLDLLGNYFEKRGIKLKIGDEHLPPNKGGAFHGPTGTLYLKSNPTQYEVWHELSHYIQYNKIGKEEYSNLPRTGRVPMNDLTQFNAPEQFVYDMLSNSPKKWNALNEAEQLHISWYIMEFRGIR